MTGAWKLAEKGVGSGGPEKLRGCIAAPPRLPFGFPEGSYRFFLAFFFAAILFSSEPFEIFRQCYWRSAYSIIMFRVTELSCQEESDRLRRKSEVDENLGAIIRFFDRSSSPGAKGKSSCQIMRHAGSSRARGPFNTKPDDLEPAVDGRGAACTCID